MVWIAVTILLLLTVLGACARKEEVPAECEASAVTKPFYRMAVYLLRCLCGSKRRGRVREKMAERIFRKNTENLRLLDPAGDARRQAQLQFVQKTGLCLLLLAVGLLFGLLLSYRESQETQLQDGSVLLRHPYGKGSYTVELTADLGEGTEEVIEVPVQQRSYTEEELRDMLPAFETALEAAALGKNESADRVCNDLDLKEALNGYPYTVTWEYSDHTLINRMGQLREEIPSEGAVLTLKAKICCDDLEAEHQFSVMVWPKELQGVEKLRQSVEEALRLSDESSRDAEQYRLPTEVDGIQIVWREEKKGSLLVLLLLVLAAVTAVWWGKDNDLEKQVKERDAQMTEDYPEVISKLSLYIGAGMTVRLAWKKLAQEYLQKSGGAEKRYVYEEMVLALREMESGVSELQAYRHFAKRCRLQKYVKLVSLLEQNVKLGAKGFLESLRKETEDALEERRSRAKTLGEEAGTRLLVPMILMLAIVMVVIIVPAFVSI